MAQRFRSVVPLLLSCLVLSACAGTRQAFFPRDAGSPGIELEKVVFFGQRDFQCGPAALAMVLHHSGEKVQPDDLTPLLFLPGRRGSLQLEMIAAARRAGRIPYLIRPEAAAIAAELAAGRPVLVLQNLGVTWLPVYHYAVVVGLLPGDQVVLRSGEQRRLVMDGSRFLATWRRADNWGMVLLRPGELPAADESGSTYLLALAAFETTGQPEIARRGYEAALERWPRQPLALFGLGNCLLALGDEEQAVMVYRSAAGDRPGACRRGQQPGGGPVPARLPPPGPGAARPDPGPGGRRRIVPVDAAADPDRDRRPAAGGGRRQRLPPDPGLAVIGPACGQASVPPLYRFTPS